MLSKGFILNNYTWTIKKAGTYATGFVFSQTIELIID